MQPELSPADLPLQQTPLYLKLATWGLLAGMGGAVKFISVTLKNKDRMRPQRFLLLLSANVFISGFSGLMGALVFSTLSPDRTWQLVAAGVGGYLGTQLLDVLALAMSRKMRDGPLPISSVIPIPTAVDPAAPERAA